MESILLIRGGLDLKTAKFQIHKNYEIVQYKTIWFIVIVFLSFKYFLISCHEQKHIVSNILY